VLLPIFAIAVLAIGANLVTDGIARLRPASSA
jgi:hypothetical protein